MSEQLLNFLKEYRQPLEDGLAVHLPLGSLYGAQQLNRALRYAVFPGGKRWRPMLALLAGKLSGVGVEEALPIACAVEYLHTCSLILDDLPAMDDAEWRRGRAALHIGYGEGIALLAALALLNKSYELMTLAATRSRLPEAPARLIAEAVACIGVSGVIGGQAVDLHRGETDNQTELLAARQLKTNGLLRLTMTGCGLAYGCKAEALSALAEFGECLGTAYQILDDVMDEVGESVGAGKPLLQDARHQRPSYVAELGLKEAYRQAYGWVTTGKQALMKRFTNQAEVLLLADAADFIIGEAMKVSAIKQGVAK
jgi:geranylgeranyl diphosphate synthase type II